MRSRRDVFMLDAELLDDDVDNATPDDRIGRRRWIEPQFVSAHEPTHVHTALRQTTPVVVAEHKSADQCAGRRANPGWTLPEDCICETHQPHNPAGEREVPGNGIRSGGQWRANRRK